VAKIPVLGQDRRLGPESPEPSHGSTQGQGAMDQSKKTMRHFYCRDVLWETFEQMANDFDCSIDYLINEAMRYYARSKNYQSASGNSGNVGSQPPPMGGPAQAPGAPMPMGGAAAMPAGGPATLSQNRRAQPVTQPPGGGPGHMGPGMPAAARRPAPQTPGYSGPGGGGGGGGGAAMPRPAPSPSGAQFAAPMPGPGGAAPAPTQPPPVGAMPVAAGATLYLLYNNQRYPITKDQFIIGRGSKTSDLAIKDGNISRKHAAVIRRNGTFYIKDLGSTNGIDYKGMRIDNKRIDEGDIFHLCDYEIRFTYRPD
jgi:neural Wiskott-Aldrich syndrome protein